MLFAGDHLYRGNLYRKYEFIISRNRGLPAFIFLKERIGPRTWLGIILSITGVIIISYMPSGGSLDHHFIVGVLLALGSAIGWGLEGVVCAWGMKGDDADPEIAVAIRQTTSALAYAIIVIPIVHGYSLASEVLSSNIKGTKQLHINDYKEYLNRAYKRSFQSTTFQTHKGD